MSSSEPLHTDSESPRQDEPAVVQPANDWSKLSRLIVRRTTDLIAISLIVVAGLTVATRLLAWWKTSPEDLQVNLPLAAASGALAPWGLGPGGVGIELGTLPLTLHREQVSGSEADAINSLQAHCRSVLETIPAEQIDWIAPVSSEAKLLDHLRRESPLVQSPDGRWRIHRVPGVIPMIVGVMHGAPPEQHDRVLCWGLILPLDGTTWTLLRVSPRLQPAPEQPTTLTWDIPNNTVRGLALQDPRGGMLLTFTGPGPVDDWKRHFEQLAVSDDWQPLTYWKASPERHSAAWQRLSPEGVDRIDLQLTHTPNGWSGLLNISPSRQKDSP